MAKSEEKEDGEEGLATTGLQVVSMLVLLDVVQEPTWPSLYPCYEEEEKIKEDCYML